MSEFKGLTRRAMFGGVGRDKEKVERESEMLVGEARVGRLEEMRDIFLPSNG